MEAIKEHLAMAKAGVEWVTYEKARLYLHMSNAKMLKE